MDKKLERAILYTLIGGAVVLSPMGGNVVIALAKYYVKKWWEKDGPYVPPEADPAQVRESIYKLKRNDYIRWKYDKKKNVVTLELTKKGGKIFRQNQFNDLTIPPSPKWDGHWRFVLFDIPEKSKVWREMFREKLKQLGFFQFQKSVWVYPFECEKEVRYTSEYFGVTPFSIMFTAKIDNDMILKRYFYRRKVLPKKYLDPKARFLRY